MASFNLGCIKGAKGDPGAKGDKGEKGDTGERGLSGADGLTPVFNVKKVETLDSTCEANVQIDSSEPSQPEITFFIPRGADGKDATGDMESAVYDSTGKKRDIYVYADELFEKSVKKDGGALAGKLVAHESGLSERCVRNISFCTEFPENASNGDLCVLMKDSAGKKLSDCEIGSVILLDEGEAKTQYLIADKDYHRAGHVTLVRRYLSKRVLYFDYHKRGSYSGSDVDIYLESVHVGQFTPYIRENIISVMLDGSIQRRCFLPSKDELLQMAYFADNGTKAAVGAVAVNEEYMTRSVNNGTYYIAVNPEGEFRNATQNHQAYIRPMITLPGDLYVESVIHDDSVASQLVENPRTMYLYKDGEWKELSL